MNELLELTDYLKPHERVRLDYLIGKKTESSRLCRSFPDDPIRYAQHFLRARLWSKQEEIITKLRTPPCKVLVRAGHSVGKSYVGGVLGNWHYDSFDPGLTIITAPTQQSVEDVLFAEIRRHRKDKSELTPRAAKLWGHEHHWCQGYTANRGESFSGRHEQNMLLMYDEATGLAPGYFEVGKGMFGGYPHSWVCFYNPTDAGSQVYHEESIGNWHIVEISQFEHPNIIAELRGEDPPYPAAVRLQQVIDQMDEFGRRLAPNDPFEEGEVSLSETLRWMPGPIADVRVLGRWPRTGAKTVWSDSLWRQMDAVRVELNPQWRVQIGCDVAGYGDDEDCIIVKQGVCVVHAERHNGWGPRRTCERLKELCHVFHGPHQPRQVPCLIDAPGVGIGVWDYADGYNFVPINPSSTPKDESRFANIRSELWFEAREFARNNLVDISRISLAERNRLKMELTTPTYGLDPADRLRVEPKAETKNKIKRSPDLADGFNLANYQFGTWGPV